MSAEVRLVCDRCGASEVARLWERWAPWGVLKLSGGTRFYVDGATVRCPEHTDSGRQREQQRGYAMAVRGDRG